MDTIFFRAMCSLFSVFIFVAIIAFSKWRELTIGRKLYNLVAWSVTTDFIGSGSVRPGLDLIDYIGNVAYAHKLPDRYKITDEKEREIAKDILKEYQRFLTQEYFSRKLSCPKTKYTDYGEHFFFANLFDFLSSHQCDYTFIGNDMHDELLSRKQYGKSYTSDSESTYKLSAFGIVFHKLLYISYLFCKESPIYKNLVPSWRKPESFTDPLDSMQITISWYRL